MSIEAIKPLAGKDIATLTHAKLVTEISRLFTEIDRLQRENAELRPYKDELLRLAESVGEKDDPFAAWEHLEPAIARAEAAESEVKRLRSGIKWCLDRDKRNGSLPGSYADKLQALASTGGEHHGN